MGSRKCKSLKWCSFLLYKSVLMHSPFECFSQLQGGIVKFSHFFAKYMTNNQRRQISFEGYGDEASKLMMLQWLKPFLLVPPCSGQQVFEMLWNPFGAIYAKSCSIKEVEQTLYLIYMARVLNWKALGPWRLDSVCNKKFKSLFKVVWWNVSNFATQSTVCIKSIEPLSWNWQF